jgi:tRNA(fMet)-specific endonuclease VapC
MIYVLDSNIVSYMLKKEAEVIANYRRTADQGHEFIILPIVRYEVERWLMAQKLKKMLTQFEILCEEALTLEFSRPVWQQAVLIYADLSQRGELIDDADIFIAAFCLTYEYTLVTNNLRHFERIDKLHTVNWKSNATF